MTRFAASLIALLVALPGAVLAQTVPGQAKAEGDALIAGARAGDLFDNLSEADGGAIRLRHKASGLVCVFNAGDAANKLLVFDSATRGDEIACSTGGEAGERTLYLTRAPGRTLAQAFTQDVAEVEKSHPGWAPYDLPKGIDSPQLQMLATPPMPASRTARFIVDHTFTSVSSAMVKDWALEYRFTCPEEQQDAAAGTLQPTLWASILAQMSGAPLDLIAPKEAV